MTDGAALEHSASFDGQNRQSHLQLLHGLGDGLPRGWMFVRFIPEPVQDPMCLGDVLDRLYALSLLFRCSLIGRHLLPL